MHYFDFSEVHISTLKQHSTAKTKRADSFSEGIERACWHAAAQIMTGSSAKWREREGGYQLTKCNIDTQRNKKNWTYILLICILKDNQWRVVGQINGGEIWVAPLYLQWAQLWACDRPYQRNGTLLWLTNLWAKIPTILLTVLLFLPRSSSTSFPLSLSIFILSSLLMAISMSLFIYLSIVSCVLFSQLYPSLFHSLDRPPIAQYHIITMSHLGLMSAPCTSLMSEADAGATTASSQRRRCSPTGHEPSTSTSTNRTGALLLLSVWTARILQHQPGPETLQKTSTEIWNTIWCV